MASYPQAFCCPNAAKGHTCSPCAELAAINQDILEAERHLANLNAKRVQIHSRMNQAHDSLVAKLPSEVISRIFTKFLPTNVDKDYGIPINRRKNLPCKTEPRTTPLLLASVCTTWRALAWSTPRLWSSISVNVSYVNDAVVEILSEWLRKSGSLPLYIGIYFDPGVDFHLHDTERISNVFAPYAPRWFYMELEALIESFPCIYSSITSAGILNTLKMGNGVCLYHDGNNINLGMIPSLRHIDMFILDFHIFKNLNWGKLTSVRGAFRTVDMLFELFSNASSLTHCTFHIPQSSDLSATHATRNVILQHDHLVFLCITIWTGPTDVALACLKLPAALEHLIVPMQTKVVADLLQRSDCALKTLDTYINPDDPEYEQHLIPFLEKVPSLKSLALIDGYPSRTSRCRPIDPLLARLSDSTITGNPDVDLLPNLKTLCITYIEASWTRILDLLLAYAANCTETSTIGANEASDKKCQHVRPVRNIHIQPCKLEGQEDIIDAHPARELQCAIRGSRVQVTVRTPNSHHPIPLMDFLQKFLYPSKIEM